MPAFAIASPLRALCCAAVFACGAASASALPLQPDGRACASAEVESGGRALPAWRALGQTWIEGRPGSEYSIVVRNRCPFRVLAVVSVDGLDVLRGQPASWASGGYIVEPWQSARIDGWRKSSDQVAAFFFSSPSGSYAAKAGQGGNLGVIGAAFFRESPPPEPALPMARLATPSPMGAAPGSPSAQDSAQAMEARRAEPSLGTGHGRRIGSDAEAAQFDREPTPFAVSALRYESRERLEELGVAPRRRSGPDPFPGQPDQGFVPDPPRGR